MLNHSAHEKEKPFKLLNFIFILSRAQPDARHGLLLFTTELMKRFTQRTQSTGNRDRCVLRFNLSYLLGQQVDVRVEDLRQYVLQYITSQFTHYIFPNALHNVK